VRSFRGITATNNKINQILNWTVSMVWPITRSATAEYISEASIFIWRSSSYSFFTYSYFSSISEQHWTSLEWHFSSTGSGSTNGKDFGQLYASNIWCSGYFLFSAY